MTRRRPVGGAMSFGLHPCVFPTDMLARQPLQLAGRRRRGRHVTVAAGRRGDPQLGRQMVDHYATLQVLLSCIRPVFLSTNVSNVSVTHHWGPLGHVAQRLQPLVRYTCLMPGFLNSRSLAAHMLGAGMAYWPAAAAGSRMQQPC